LSILVAGAKVETGCLYWRFFSFDDDRFTSPLMYVYYVASAVGVLPLYSEMDEYLGLGMGVWCWGGGVLAGNEYLSGYQGFCRWDKLRKVA
jgi:hypothetical protein